ncbi:MAG: hypothetical protein WA908_03010 [Pontixanthobacter sp.]
MNKSDDFSTGSGASRPAGSTKDELKQDASQLKDTAARQASAKADEASDKATSAARSTSSALRDAGDTLENDSDTPNWLGNAFKQAADSIAQFAETVEGKEPREMMRDVSRFGRDNPAAFLAGAAMAGFAAARVMKAGAEQSDAKLGDLDPNRSSGTDGKTGVNSGDNTGSSRFTASSDMANQRSTPEVAPATPMSPTVRQTTGGA